MITRDVFQEDINRPINGVIKVDQDMPSIVEQEVHEYVITKELKKHFISFFNFYDDAFNTPTADIGVWISGFFGSGKSHLLKILSYLLENRPVGDTTTVELFRKKFGDDPATFMLVDHATHGETKTILFNIDIEGSINKDKTAVLRVFAKMFFNSLGFYGDNLKVAMLEQYIEHCGKTEAYRQSFRTRRGKSWEEQRKAFAFNGKYIIPTLMEVMNMSEEDARNWFNDRTAEEYSIAQLVADIKEYVDSKPQDFRLVFMVDEVGQYVGTDTDLLLNLQSLIEKLGSECGGKVWVVCTGQEAIDEIISVRVNEFSRIQARFRTRLSLSSSSVDEVIQQRILKKKPAATAKLELLYHDNDSVLRNLFCFSDCILDIKGFSGASEFAIDFPFVPYQFIILPKVFTEIRKHGNAGRHLAGGERSMLSGFQECAQKVQEKDEYTIIPFFDFYDTVHTFLEGPIRRVIERCERAADSGAGIQAYDVNVLKLLYLIRYIDNDIKATLDNIVILMADDIRTDKISLREAVRESLGRLQNQNYIGRSGDTYNFLTDEEQDVQREIKDTAVDTSAIVERIAQLIFGDIYTVKKYRFGKYDFEFDKMVDGVLIGAVSGGMRLRFLTVATDASEKASLRLMGESQGQAIVVLSDTPYYETLESAMKIRKYVKQRNVAQLPKSVQDIIRDRLQEANALEQTIIGDLIEAMLAGVLYVDGEILKLKPLGVSVSMKEDDLAKRELEGKKAKARSVIDQALEYLVSHVYNELELVDTNIESDAAILDILFGTEQLSLGGSVPNQNAAAKVEEYLEVQYRKNLPTSMADIQGRFQAIPYGWREIDIAAVVARLIFDQKLTVKYAGGTIQPTDPKLPDLLRKKSEIGKTVVSIRQIVSATKTKAAREFLREYFDVMDVPDKEDGLISFIVARFTTQREHYIELEKQYTGHKYPDHVLVQKAISLIDDVLSQQKDNTALIDRVVASADVLLDNKTGMANVESFFKNQVTVFDEAVGMEYDLSHELDYLSKEPEANTALNQIRLIIVANVGDAKYVYRRIPELNSLMQTVRAGHTRLLDAKRIELLGIVRQCMEAIHIMAGSDSASQTIITAADSFYLQKKQRIAELKSLALLDGLVPPMLTYKDDTCSRLEAVEKPVPEPKSVHPTDGEKPHVPPKKIIKALNRQIVFPARQLESETDIDEYVEKIRAQLKMLMQNCDGIKLN